MQIRGMWIVEYSEHISFHPVKAFIEVKLQIEYWTPPHLKKKLPFQDKLENSITALYIYCIY